MKEHIIRLSELAEYHQIKEVYENRVACFEMNSQLVNIDTIPPVFADIFSVVLVQQGSATFSLNYREQTVAADDMLLFWPSLLVSLTRQSSNFKALHLLCERTLFERLLATDPAYRQYPLFFCQTQSPILHLHHAMAETLAADLQQIARHIVHPSPYQEGILHHLLHVVPTTSRSTTSGFMHAICRFRPPTSRASFARPPAKRPPTSSPDCSTPKPAACCSIPTSPYRRLPTR